MTTPVEQVLKRAIDAHRRGAVQEAKPLYRRALELHPSSEIACTNLAVIAAQEGDVTQAEQLFRRALTLRANYPEGHSNLGLFLQQQGRLDEAIAAYRQAVALSPNYPQARYGLGNALKQQGKLEEAMVAYQQALQSNPDHVEARINLGVLLQQQGRLEDAAAAFRHVIRLRPDYVEGHYNLGFALQEQGRLDEALAAYRQVIKLRPISPAAFNNLGLVLQQQGRPDDAISAFQRAIACSPTHVDAHFNLGAVLQQQARIGEAAAAYRHAIKVKPDHVEARHNLALILHDQGYLAEARAAQQLVVKLRPNYAEGHNNLGASLLDEGRLPDAVDAFRHALMLKPDYPEAHYNLGNALREQGELEMAIAAYRRALQLEPAYAEAFCQLVYHRYRACDWTDREADQSRLLEIVREGSEPIPPFVLVATDANAADQLRCARKWAEKFRLPPKDMLVHKPRPERGRLRIGYLSADFHQHATAFLMAELLERHDRSRFDVRAYSSGPDDGSGTRHRIVGAFEHFTDIRGMSHREAAERIFADEVDVLIDLKGYTHHSRPMIMALRPAPVQVSYLGYPGTMGADWIDYAIVDRFVVPPDQQALFSEKLAYLPGCYQPNDTRRRLAAIPSRGECGLPENGFVFCCFNNTFKITPAFFEIWSSLLEAQPGSVLWLLESNALARRNLCTRAASRGIDPARLVFAPIVPQPEHLARQGQADLFLDTLPCNAHTTASDALWAGLPVLTCVGETFAGRVAGSLLTAAGLPELVTTSLQDYERLALELARDGDRRRALREKLRHNRSANPLFDMARRTRDIETLYTRMWEIWRTGRQPASIALDGMPPGPEAP